MFEFILLVIVALLGYILAGWVHKNSFGFKFSEKLDLPQCNISANRINEILLQENHGEDIDSVVENVKKSNPSLPFTLKI